MPKQNPPQSATVIPFPSQVEPEPPPLAERLAARRVYREAMKGIASRAVGNAFSESCKVPGVYGLDLDYAVPLFVAAMRRELRRSGQF